jgi:CBS domain-containing protein
MNVKNILAIKGRNVITIGPDKSIKEAIALMDAQNIGALIVLDEAQQLVGIISERDIIRAFVRREDVLSLPVSQLMTTKVITGVPQDDIHSISNLMTEHRVRHLPILSNGQLVGIISIGDVVKRQRDTYKGEVDTLQTQLMGEA